MIVNKYTKDEINRIYNSIISNNSQFILLRGGIGVGKTLYAKALAYLLCSSEECHHNLYDSDSTIKYEFKEKNEKIEVEVEEGWISRIEEGYRSSKLDNRIQLMQFNKNTDYTNFVYGLNVCTDCGNIKYEMQERMFLNILLKAKNCALKKYVLILDDINRADFSRVMGDVLSAVETAGKGNVIRVGEQVYEIPENLILIATYNPNIGDSVIDYAWSRRFFVYDIFSDERHIVTDERIIRKRNNVKEGTFRKNVYKSESARYEIITDYIYHIYMQVKIMCERYLLESDNNIKNQLIPGHGLFMTYDEEKDFKDNVIKFNNKLTYCIVPLLYQYLKDGLLDQEASFDVEALEHLWDKEWKKSEFKAIPKELKGAIKKPAIEMLISLKEGIPLAVFYFFFLHNIMLLRECGDMPKCFLFETDNTRYKFCWNGNDNELKEDCYHLKGQYVMLGNKRYYSFNLFDKDGDEHDDENVDLKEGQISMPYLLFEFIKQYIRVKQLYSSESIELDVLSPYINIIKMKKEERVKMLCDISTKI